MGEFHVEDTYVNAPLVKESVLEEKSHEDGMSDSVVAQEQDGVSERQPQNRTAGRQTGAHRNTQQLYEPRRRQEYSRSGRRGKFHVAAAEVCGFLLSEELCCTFFKNMSFTAQGILIA